MNEFLDWYEIVSFEQLAIAFISFIQCVWTSDKQIVDPVTRQFVLQTRIPYYIDCPDMLVPIYISYKMCTVVIVEDGSFVHKDDTGN